MEETLTEFNILMQRILNEGRSKYGDAYKQSDQLEFIREKLRRIDGSTPVWKKQEDLVKIAAYAYLGYHKLNETPRVIALSSFTSDTAQTLLKEGLIGRFIHETESSIGDIYNQLTTQKYYDTLIMLGWAHKLPQGVLQRFGLRCYNLHPGTLPDLPGRDPHIRALDEKRAYTHATIHRVTDVIDSGPVMMQHVVFINDDDTPESLLTRLKLAGLKLTRLFLKEIA